ncbi:MAG: hypothetical protein WB791_00410 [Waddliaceae bacterium]
MSLDVNISTDSTSYLQSSCCIEGIGDHTFRCYHPITAFFLQFFNMVETLETKNGTIVYLDKSDVEAWRASCEKGNKRENLSNVDFLIAMVRKHQSAKNQIKDFFAWAYENMTEENIVDGWEYIEKTGVFLNTLFDFYSSLKGKDKDEIISKIFNAGMSYIASHITDEFENQNAGAHPPIRPSHPKLKKN